MTENKVHKLKTQHEDVFECWRTQGEHQRLNLEEKQGEGVDFQPYLVKEFPR